MVARELPCKSHGVLKDLAYNIMRGTMLARFDIYPKKHAWCKDASDCAVREKLRGTHMREHMFLLPPLVYTYRRSLPDLGSFHRDVNSLTTGQTIIELELETSMCVAT